MNAVSNKSRDGNSAASSDLEARALGVIAIPQVEELGGRKELSLSPQAAELSHAHFVAPKGTRPCRCPILLPDLPTLVQHSWTRSLRHQIGSAGINPDWPLT
eukprot:g1899.t1